MSVKEKTRMFIFTASEQKRKKKIRKAIIITAAATTTTPKMVVMVTNRSFKTFMTLYLTGSVSNDKCIV